MERRTARTIRLTQVNSNSKVRHMYHIGVLDECIYLCTRGGVNELVLAEDRGGGKIIVKMTSKETGKKSASALKLTVNNTHAIACLVGCTIPYR